MSAASLSFYVTDAQLYLQLVRLNERAWGESTATWARYDGTNNWTTVWGSNTTIRSLRYQPMGRNGEHALALLAT